MDCLFCAIAAGDIPSHRVYEDDVAYAFLDISPWQVGHTLVIPRRHSVDVLEDDAVLAEIAPSVARVGACCVSGWAPTPAT
nr:HIT domain-containing protein [Tessaracoccus coleopterorum]